MFKKTDAQRALFDAASRLPESGRDRLKRSWAEGFREEVLPQLMEMEEEFAKLYGETGRPNYSVSRILGICLLQEMNLLSDQAAVDSFAFDARWQHALDVAGDEAYLSRRSLVEFRRRLVEQDRDMTLMRRVFERISQKAMQRLHLSAKAQRLDSTLVVSNIRIAGLLEVFRSTAQLFLRGLDAEQRARLPPKIRKWEEQSHGGWFGLGPSERRDKLSELLPHIKRLIPGCGSLRVLGVRRQDAVVAHEKLACGAGISATSFSISSSSPRTMWVVPSRQGRLSS